MVTPGFLMDNVCSNVECVVFRQHAMNYCVIENVFRRKNESFGLSVDAQSRSMCARGIRCGNPALLRPLNQPEVGSIR